ncbi:MAG TPA: DinB family protein [Pyrinomonadaceae bacterium]|nr:DinB family protein [Pyrinomonadaceae bacterium]
MSAAAPAVKPGSGEYASYYEKYVALVPEGDVVETLGRQMDETLALLAGVDEGRAGGSYEPGKWSVKELVGHIIDSERVFAYRALRFARGDQTPLPGFDQETFSRHVDFDSRPLPHIIEEFASVRRATLSLLGSFDEEAWGRRGVASDNEVSVRALAYIIAGHEAHHVRILRERYLKEG